MELSDPSFPHGTKTGYNKGCRKTFPCPATPTCNDASNAQNRAYRRKAAGRAVEGRLTTYVVKRLNATIAAVGVDALADEVHMSPRRLRNIASGRDPVTKNARIPEPLAAKLDRAWTLLAHGITPEQLAARPHGTATTYINYWCRCLPCTEAATVCRKRSRLGIVAADQTLVPMTEPLLARLEALIEAAGSRHLFCKVTGLAPTQVGKMRKIDAQLRGSTVRILTEWTPATMREAAEREADCYVPAARTYWLMGTLAAMGYPIIWQHRQAGLWARRRNRADGVILRSTEQALESLHKRFSGEFARPGKHGLTKGGIAHAKTYAAKNGFHPPFAYDDDMNLIERAIPGHPWAKMDELCAAKIMALHHMSTGMTTKAAAREVGLNQKTISGERFPHGLTYLDGVSVRSGHVHLDYKASRDRIRQIADVKHRWESGLIGPVTAYLELGLTLPETGRGALAADHPEYVEWLAQQPNEPTEQAVIQSIDFIETAEAA
jgi:hypothetical protein